MLAQENRINIIWFISASIVIHLMLFFLLHDMERTVILPSLMNKPIFINLLDRMPVKSITSLPEATEEEIPLDSSLGTSSLPGQADESMGEFLSKTETVNEVQVPLPGSSIPALEKTSPVDKKQGEKVVKLLPLIDLLDLPFPPATSPPLVKWGRGEKIKRRSFNILKEKSDEKDLEYSGQSSGLLFFGESEKDIVARSFKLSNEKKEVDRISINTHDLQFLSYMLKLKGKVKMAWHYPLLAQQYGWGGRVLLQFTLNREGGLEEMRVLDSSGHRLLDNSVISAIEAAVPFDRFPELWGLNYLEIHGQFIYKNNYLVFR